MCCHFFAARLEQIRVSAGTSLALENALPALSHRGNVTVSHADDVNGRYGSSSDDPSRAPFDHECAICMDRTRDSLLCPCHHMITCGECAKSLQNRNDFCPVCRKQITSVIRVYHS